MYTQCKVKCASCSKDAYVYLTELPRIMVTYRFVCQFCKSENKISTPYGFMSSNIVDGSVLLEVLND